MKIMDGVNGGNSNDFLDITQLLEGNIYEKVALVTSASAGLTKQMSGFAKFFLKDIHSNVICARLFDVEDFNICGLKLTAFKNKPVKIKFVVQMFNGSPSLIIDGSYGVQEYTGAFDYGQFIGTMDYDDTIITALGKRIFGDSWELNPAYKVESFDTVGQGRVGAFMKVFDIAMSTLAGYANIDGIDYAGVLLPVAFEAMECLFYREKNRNTFGVLDNIKNFDYLMNMNSKYHMTDLQVPVIDTLRVIMETAKPSNIYSHLVTSSINNALTNINLVLVNNSLSIGSFTNVGGAYLSKI